MYETDIFVLWCTVKKYRCSMLKSKAMINVIVDIFNKNNCFI